MDPRVQAAYIAGSIAILGFVINYLVVRVKIRAELKALKLNQKHAFTEKLYILRLDAYPEVFNIIQDIGKRGDYSNEDIISITEEVTKKLLLWQRTKAGLLLSKQSLDAYYQLKQKLLKKPADKNGYSDTQLKNIWYARNSFRGCLRNDVGLLHDDEL